MKKIFIFVVLGIILIIGLGLGILSFYTYSVSGRIIDLATKEPISNIKVRIDEFTDETNKDGLFQIKSIKIYQRKALEIEIPEDYEELQPIFLDYSKRTITKDITLAPTLMTMVNRLNRATRNFQTDYLWDFMHPDDQQYWESKEDFTEIFQKIDEIMVELDCSPPEYKIIEEDIRKLEVWKYRIRGKEYHDVMEVPIKVKQFCGEKEQTSDIPQHWQKIEGVWRYFTHGNKEELEEELERFRGRFKENY